MSSIACRNGPQTFSRGWKKARMSMSVAMRPILPDVHTALIDIVASQAHTGREAAEDYVRSLQADHRYQRDVY